VWLGVMKRRGGSNGRRRLSPGLTFLQRPSRDGGGVGEKVQGGGKKKLKFCEGGRKGLEGGPTTSN